MLKRKLFKKMFKSFYNECLMMFYLVESAFSYTNFVISMPNSLSRRVSFHDTQFKGVL